MINVFIFSFFIFYFYFEFSVKHDPVWICFGNVKGIIIKVWHVSTKARRSFYKKSGDGFWLNL